MRRALARVLTNWLRRLRLGRGARPTGHFPADEWSAAGRDDPRAQPAELDDDGFDADGVRVLGKRRSAVQRAELDVPVGDIDRLGDLDQPPPGAAAEPGAESSSAAAPAHAVQVELPFDLDPEPAPDHRRAEGDEPGAAGAGAGPSAAAQSQSGARDAAQRGSGTRRPRARPETAARDGQLDEENRTDLRLGAGELIISLYVMHRERQPFDPIHLKAVLESTGVRLGKMSIYHHLGVGDSQAARPVFSVASAVEPGTFDADVPASYAVPGLVLFMRLPGRQDGRVTFELMLHTAERLADDLDGVLLDDRRSTLSAQAVNSLRENVTEFGRRQQLASRSA